MSDDHQTATRKRRASPYPTLDHHFKRSKFSDVVKQGEQQNANLVEREDDTIKDDVQAVVVVVASDLEAGGIPDLPSRTSLEVPSQHASPSHQDATTVDIPQPLHTSRSPSSSPSPFSRGEDYARQQFSNAIANIFARRGLTREDLERMRANSKQGVIENKAEPLFRPATPTADDSDEAIALYAMGSSQPVGFNDVVNDHVVGDVQVVTSGSESPQLREISLEEILIEKKRYRGGPPTADNMGRLWTRRELKYFRKLVFTYGESDWESHRKAMNAKFRYPNTTWSIPLMKSRWLSEKTAMIVTLQHWRIDTKDITSPHDDDDDDDDDDKRNLATFAEPFLVRWVSVFGLGGEEEEEWSEEKHNHWTIATSDLIAKFKSIGKEIPDAFYDGNGHISGKLIWKHWLQLQNRLVNAPDPDIEDPDIHASRTNRTSIR